MQTLTGVFSGLLTAMQSTLNYFAAQVALLAISLAFIAFAIRLIFILFKDGYDRFVPAFKDHFVKFMVIVGLCLPISVPPMNNNSVISAFPQLIITSGFTTAQALIGQLPSNAQGGGTLETLPTGLTGKLLAVRGANNSPAAIADMISQAETTANSLLPDVSTLNTIQVLTSGNLWKVIGYALVILIVLIPFAILIWFLAGPFAIPILTMMAALVLGMFCSIAGLAQPTNNYTVAELLLKQITLAMADFLFVSVLTFSFYGVLFSAIIKGVIYAVTFPIAVVTLPFESTKAHFYSHIARSFQLALTPILAAAIFAVALYGYAYLTTAGGLFEQMITIFVDRAGASNSFWEFVMYFFRWLFAIFVGPIALAAPIAKYMLQVPRMASELIGTGITYSSGMAESMASMGPGKSK